MLYRSTDRLCRCGAAVKNLSHSASLESGDKGAPSNPGIKHLGITPNAALAKSDDRMPVFLTQEQFAPWLSGEVGADYLKPAPNDYLQRWPVSKRVNSSKGGC